MTHILIANAWTANRGDEAQLDLLIYHIKRIYPAGDIDVLLVNSKQCQLASRVNFLPFITEELARGRFSIFHDDLYNNLVKNINKKYDYIIMAPQGPDIGDLYLHQRMNYGISMGKWAQKNKIPFQFSAASYGPFIKYIACRKKVLRCAHSVIAREPISFSYLLDFNKKKNNIYLTTDWTFLYQESNFPLKIRTNEFQRVENLFKNNSFIGANINLTTIKKISHNKISETNYWSIEELAQFFDRLIEKTGCYLALFSHIYNLDIWPLKKILNFTKHRKKIYLINPTLKWYEIIKLFSYLQFFISFRYHPTIFSILNDVPFISVINQHKTEGMLNMLNLEHLSIYEDKGSQLAYDLFENIWQHRSLTLKSIRESKCIIKEQSQLNVVMLEKFLTHI